MRAVRWHGRGDVRLEDVADAPPPGPGEVRVEVAWCGICGTDVEEFTAGPIVIAIEPHPTTGHCAPMVIGHEVAGWVTDVGAGVGDLEPGRLVALDGVVFCRQCDACRRHEPNLCARWANIGMGYPGGLAEAITVPATMAVPAPVPVAPDVLALAEPVAVAVRAVRQAGHAARGRVAVLGGGTIGLAVLQVLDAQGVKGVIVAEPGLFRRSRAEALGAAEVVDDAGSLRGAGFDLVVDCTGANTATAAAIHAVRPGGRVVLVSLPPEPVPLDLVHLAICEIELIGSNGHVYDEDTRRAVQLLCVGAVEASALITHRLPLDQAVAGIEMLANPERGDVLKVLISGH